MPLRGKQASGLLTQQKMLRAAVKLFLEKRYEGTTTAEIARAAGMMRSFVAVPCDMYFTVERKIARFLECALKLYNVPVERRREVTAAVLQLDLHAMAAGIIQTTVQQAEKGFEAVKAEPAF